MTLQTALPNPASALRYLKGVGPKRAQALEKLGIRSIRDLLYFFPRRYEDRSSFCSISDLRAGDSATIRGEVLAVQVRPIRRMPLVELTVGDAGGTVTAVWFNRPYLKNQFKIGQEIILFGRVEFYKNRLQINSPEYECGDGADHQGTHTGRITPIYPLTEGLFQRSLRATMRDVVEGQLPQVIQEFLPPSFRRENGLLELREAIREMHFPSCPASIPKARRRIVFDEFLIFEITLLRKMERMRTQFRAFALPDHGLWAEKYEASLPFKLTPSQKKAIGELAFDLAQEIPMNRLLMGDVGSGKTAVGAFAIILSAKHRHQSALLVPTEILAIQHYRNLKRLLEGFDVSIRMLSASTLPQERERIVAELHQGKIDAVVGTHALLQEDVRFKSLACVIIDEQHKFGVHQRCRLLEIDPRPHQLVMTATPIPRTLALTVYGDLSISTMRDMPAGRQPVKTYWITRAKQAEVWRHMLEKVRSGEQAYIIFPLIEETEKSDLLAAKEEYERLRNGYFHEVKMGLVHGRLSAEERDGVMNSFRRGDIRILVATSVVEVGVDNPNASIIVIENAERFGLSQLHQMRGRVGRGLRSSECFLFGEPTTAEGKKRLRILTKSQDGFQIAQEDLRLRGPGDFWGIRQSGEPLFQIAHPVLDEAVLLEARQVALNLVKKGLIENPDWKRLKNFLEEFPLRY